METSNRRVGPEEQLVSAMERVSINRDQGREEPELHVTIPRREGVRGVRRIIEKGVWTGCLVGHFPWTPEMDDEDYVLPLKPIEVEICKMPIWAKEDIPRVFMTIGQDQGENSGVGVIQRNQVPLIDISESRSDAQRQGYQCENRLLEIPFSSARQEEWFRALREETPDWLKTLHSSESSGCSQTADAHQAQGLITPQEPASYTRTTTRQRQQKSRTHKKTTHIARGGTSLQMRRGSQNQQDKEAQNTQLEDRTMKKKRFAADHTDILSEPSLELNLGEDLPVIMNPIGDSLLLTSWNVGGMRTPHRRYALKRFLMKERPQFVVLQETHLEAERIKFFVSTLTSEYGVIASSSEGRMKGVALLYSRNLELIESREGFEGRVVWGKFRAIG
ncbi:hypothetical protein R1sor_022842 [Riccia sorocarpa]|uniref:Endonuclease/exonuclease/phosphatase domain-containing protein n=1 Tax=Riccia sorocarpa TaxID=122646 RepID=A0ABD3GPX7_9MARC